MASKSAKTGCYEYDFDQEDEHDEIHAFLFPTRTSKPCREKRTKKIAKKLPLVTSVKAFTDSMHQVKDFCSMFEDKGTKSQTNTDF